MRALADLLKDWEAMGIVFKVRGDDHLDLDAPSRLLTPDRLELIKAHKPALIRFLRDREEALDHAEVRGWITILREAGAKIGVFNGTPEITWPPVWDMPWRRKEWQRNLDRILRILRE